MEKKEIKIVNPKQVYCYVQQGINPIRIECGREHKLVFIFNKDDTREVWEKWFKFELDYDK